MYQIVYGIMIYYNSSEGGKVPAYGFILQQLGVGYPPCADVPYNTIPITPSSLEFLGTVMQQICKWG